MLPPSALRLGYSRRISKLSGEGGWLTSTYGYAVSRASHGYSWNRYWRSYVGSK